MNPIKKTIHVSFIGLSLLLGGFFLSGCETTKGSAAVESYNAAPLTVGVPQGVTSEQVTNAMRATLAGREWTITQSSSNEVVGILDHRGYQAAVTLMRVGDQIQILSNSQELNSKTGEYVPAVPMGWLENLQKDLRKNLNRMAYTSFN